MLREVNLTQARNLSPLFTEAVREGRPIGIRRNRDEFGVLLPRDMLVRLLEAYHLHVEVMPQEDGSFSLWLRELKIGSHGATLGEARADMVTETRAFVQDYLDDWGIYRRLHDMAELEPFVRRLSLARDDDGLRAMLFPPRPGDGDSSGVATNGRAVSGE